MKQKKTIFLIDYSTVCFLDSYQPAYIMAADKVLTELAKRYVEKLSPVKSIVCCSFSLVFLFFFRLKTTAELSKDFVRTSLNEFEDDPILNPVFIEELRTNHPNSPLARAYQAYDQCHFTNIPSLCTEELQSSSYKLQTLLLRGTFHLLMGNYREAIVDFDAVINNPNVTEQVRDSSCFLFFVKILI